MQEQNRQRRAKQRLDEEHRRGGGAIQHRQAAKPEVVAGDGGDGGHVEHGEPSLQRHVRPAGVRDGDGPGGEPDDEAAGDGGGREEQRRRGERALALHRIARFDEQREDDEQIADDTLRAATAAQIWRHAPLDDQIRAEQPNPQRRDPRAGHALAQQSPREQRRENRLRGDQQRDIGGRGEREADVLEGLVEDEAEQGEEGQHEQGAAVTREATPPRARTGESISAASVKRIALGSTGER